jgi:glycosyltransferase involved in cell wall biosynthesis
MPNPVLSIITSTYNALPYVEETAKSIQELDVNYEWIIYDNCSTDGTKSYLKLIDQTNNKTRVFFNNNNLGSPFPNFSKGITDAKGKYLIFVDSDDTLPTNRALKDCMEALDSNRNIHIAISEVAYMDEKGAIYKHKRIPFAKNRNVISGKLLFWIILLWPTYPTKFGAIMVRKTLFERTGHLFDIDLVLRASYFTSFAIIKRVGLNYRNSPFSQSSKRNLECQNLWNNKINKVFFNGKYFGLKLFFINYKRFFQILKIIYCKFTHKRI